MLQNKLRHSFNTVKCSPYEDKAGALRALLDFKAQELSLVNAQLMCYQRLLDFTVDSAASYRASINNYDQYSPILLNYHYCQGDLKQTRFFQTMNILCCNSLCLLTKEAFNKVQKIERAMGDLDYRFKLIGDEIAVIKERLKHLTNGPKINYRSSRSQTIVQTASDLHLK
jgi:hypothetical protein